MNELDSVQILQNELEKSRGRLKEFNHNIKKFTGFDNPQNSERQTVTRVALGERVGRRFGSDNQDRNDNISGRLGRGRGRLFGIAKRGLVEDNGPAVKRRIVGGAFSRLGPVPGNRRVREESPEEEELPKGLSVHSSIVATSRDAKNRQEIMQEQTKDKEGMQRNRRMFGLLMGTLNRFKKDSKTMETKEEQRKRIDKKLEENAEKERKKFKQDTKQLIEERHLEETRLSRLEQKMEVVEEHAHIEKEMKKLKNFLCTKAKPHIFWKPKEMNTAADTKLKDSAKIVDNLLDESQKRLEKEIKDVMEREQKREERIKMRLREDGLFQEEGDGGNETKASQVVVGEKGDAQVDDEEMGDVELEEVRIVERSHRRVVVEEDPGDENSQSDAEEDIKEELDRDESDKNEDKGNDSDQSAKIKKSKDKGSEGSSNESQSDSESEDEKKSDGGEKKLKVLDKDKNKDEEAVKSDAEDNSRVVMYVESSKDIEKTDHYQKGDIKKEKKDREEKHGRQEDKDRHTDEKHSRREDKDRHTDEKHSRQEDKDRHTDDKHSRSEDKHRHSDDKHSHRSSKHSRHDRGRDEHEEKRKRRSDRKVVDDSERSRDKEDRSSRKKSSKAKKGSDSDSD